MKKTNQNLGIKIDALGVKDLKEVNKMLKALESDLRITKTEISQMKEMGNQAKKGFNKILGAFKE